MEIAALVTWIAAALGGFWMLGIWLTRRRESGTASRIAPGLILGHFLLAAVGLVLWIVFLVAEVDGLTWVALAVLLVVAVLGFTMFARWLSGRGDAAADSAPEQRFPVPAVYGHGLLGAATLVLVLLVALDTL